MSQRTQITIHQLNFTLPNGKVLFDNLNLVFAKRKIGLVGKNGIGKSALLQLIVGELYPLSGSIHAEGTLTYVSQSWNSLAFSNCTIAGLLGFEQKIQALQRIYQGSIAVQDFIALDEDWQVEDRLQQQLQFFDLHYLAHDTPIHQLSGGEITRLRLTRAFFSHADFLLFDEPTNHLDSAGKEKLYQAIQNWPGGIVVASHDRRLLNFMEEIIELNTLGIACYGGNYTHYAEQKSIAQAAHVRSLEDAKKLLQKTSQTIQASREKHEQKQLYGRNLRKSGSILIMVGDSKKDRSERSQNKLSIKQERLTAHAQTKLDAAKARIEINDEIHVELPATRVPHGKLILKLEQVTFAYSHTEKPIIKNFSLQFCGPKRIALAGNNGSGKTTLVNLILGHLNPIIGTVYLGTEHICYLDQQASLLDPELSLLENFMALNPTVKEYDAYRCLAAFLFKNVTARKLAKQLSGGERLRAVLACVLMTKQPPQLLILDEPTNHLDLSSISQLESALKNYQGAMILISHDQEFLNNIGIEEVLHAPFVS